MSNLQDLAAQLMEIGGKVPVALAKQVHALVQEAHQMQSDSVAMVGQVLGDSPMNSRLQQAGSEALTGLGESLAPLEMTIAMLEGYRASLQDAAAELLR
ncbi:hypothetical protein F9C11_21550 [Amycolatopsis sp. VS8301801F10]|uniref:hypothetical protein n=1 Tax=Amycolatopsis sp. VS8301801F10 TaxID=2652442 RepID=UPI0038FD038B